MTRDPMLTHPRPRPVRDSVQGPVTWQVAATTLAMFILHGVLDRYADPAQYGPIWGAVQVLVEAGIVGVVGWLSTRRAVTQAERFVTPVESPYGYDAGGRLVQLVPHPDDPGRAWPATDEADVGFFDQDDPPPPEPPHDRY
jgi:hypothetical protein